MSTASVLTVPSFTEVLQRLTTIPTFAHAFLSRSRAARVLASGAVLVFLYRLIRGGRKPKKYVNSTMVGETANNEGLAEYDIIIVGGGMLFFLEYGQVVERQRFR